MREDNKTDDFEVIRQVLDGDTRAFGILIDRYKDRSLSLLLSMVHDHDEAEDILQDAFIKAYEGLKKFNFNSSFSTWLYRIVVNTSYTAILRSKKRSNFLLEDEHSNTTTTTLDSFDILQAKERKEIVHKVLDNLKPQESLVLKLFYLGEQRIQEIAEITGMSQANIKVLLHRARKQFHAELEKVIGQQKKNLL